MIYNENNWIIIWMSRKPEFRMSGATSGVKMDRLESSDQPNNGDNLQDDERKRNPSNAVNDKVGSCVCMSVCVKCIHGVGRDTCIGTRASSSSTFKHIMTWHGVSSKLNLAGYGRCPKLSHRNEWYSPLRSLDLYWYNVRDYLVSNTTQISPLFLIFKLKGGANYL